MRHNVVIIGAGPAGVATAIQLKRYGITPLLFEKEAVGGLLRNAQWVENYPGFPHGIGGLDLVRRFAKQLEVAELPVCFENVLEVRYGEGTFFIKTDQREMLSSVVVLASGTKPKTLKDFPISDVVQNQLFYEVFPLLKVKKKDIAIVGAGDVAFDYALTMAKKNRVKILNRRSRARCIPVLLERCSRTRNVNHLQNVRVQDIRKCKDKLAFHCIFNGTKEELIFSDYGIVAVGREPCVDFVHPQVQQNLSALINSHKVFLVGDVCNPMYRQTAIGVGNGVQSAMKISEIIRRED